ncbi:hypothetical protein QLQ15_09275 [Lysobacter sp. LF1]|uniref:Lipoprotein n=1 Tax=Lysobacter stagni TaxID=3045172 RepID=A0ABT6XG26_9GAMM|nr:hypothetical protein [Lysobacter sp. LF1]MDI9239099.1 hypothetical protein [Lysobacter sp. LF1]
MTRVLAILTALTLVGCNSSEFPAAKGASCQAPFADLANSGASTEDQQVLREASEDFCAVVSGKEPRHAKFDDTAALPSDGGTLFYVGRKYRLTVLNSLSSFGSLNGTAHGPILTFDESFAPGNTNVISNIRVYPLPRSQEGR